MNKKPIQVSFAPGALDDLDFESQAELDEFVANITAMFQDGSFVEQSRPVDMQKLQDSDPELYAKLVEINNSKRTLQ